MKLVLVDWLDSCAGRGWQTGEQLERGAEAMRCRSVGWLMKRTKDCVVIVPHIAFADQAGGINSGCGDMSIPRVAITKMRTLK